MALSKLYTRINWENEPSVRTPISESNLNAMDSAIDSLDNRVITIDTQKADEDDLLLAIKTITFDESTGIFTFTRFNDTIIQVDTLLEKIVTNWDFDDDPASEHYQQLVITTKDGTVKYVDLSALLTQYEFNNTSTIAFTVDTNGKVSANVIDGSITEGKLSLTYKAQLDQKVTAAQGYANDSLGYANQSKAYYDAVKAMTAYVDTTTGHLMFNV